VKYCIGQKIHDFPKYFNFISISHMGGNQWEKNIFHLPDPRFYNVIVLLDGEHKERIGAFFSTLKDKRFNMMKSFGDFKDQKINVITLQNRNIEEFGRKELSLTDFRKTCGMAEQVWQWNNDTFNQLNPNRGDLLLLTKIFRWALDKTGYTEKNPGPVIRTPRSERWEVQFKDYKEFLLKWKRRPNNNKNKTEKRVKNWERVQKMLLAEGTLPPERKARIDTELVPLGWDWNPAKKTGRKFGSKDREPRKKSGYHRKKIHAK
jgi:hypothetical protein